MRTCVIFNPAARGDKARHFRDHLAALSTQVTLKPTYAAGSGRILAATAVQEGFDTIVAAGGDGTVNEVVNGMGDIPDGYAKARLGLLPLGTINVFARELGLPRAFEPAWKTIERGREMRIDLPEGQFEEGGLPARRFFAQLAGAGLDSRAIELVDWEQKKALGPLAYVIAGFKAMREPKSSITVEAPGMSATGQLVLVGNGRLYGGSFKLFPKAELQDGLLDVTVFPRVNWEVLLRSGWGWLTGQIHASAGCQTFQASRVTLTSTEKIPFELDGDNAGHLPVTFTIKPQILRVIVP